MPILQTLADRQRANATGVDRAFAERVLFAPMAKGRADTERASVEIGAVLRVGGGDETNLSGGYAQEWRSRIAAGKAELHVDRAAWPDVRFRSGDKVRAVERPGQPWFEVLRVDDRGDTRLVVALGEA